ncbi:sulfotransferase 1A1 isoform X2 [Procambarus clarkii]
MSNQLASGHEVVAMSEEWMASMAQEQTLYKQGMVRLLPDGWLLPTSFTQYADTIYNFKFNSSDVVLIGMRKSGTTWMLELLWTMLHNPELNNPKGDSPIVLRAPLIELDMFFDNKNFAKMIEGREQFIKEFNQACPGKKLKDGVFLELTEALPAPRVIRTHLPLSLLPPDLLDKAKVVYIARNPKDMVVSLFHHFCNVQLHNYTCTFDSVMKHFMNDDLLYNPFWPHVKMAWKNKDHPNMHFLFYEDLKTDVMKELRTLNEFLGTRLTQQQLDNVIEHTSFSSMKNRSIKNPEIYLSAQKKKDGFFRKGELHCPDSLLTTLSCTHLVMLAGVELWLFGPASQLSLYWCTDS